MDSISGDSHVIPQRAVLTPYTKQIVQMSVIESFLDVGRVSSEIACIRFGTISEVVG